MKKRMLFVLALALLLCLMGTAGAEKRVIPDFWLPMKAGETCLPDYPDWGYMIGEGLTKEDFDITYLSRSYMLEIGEDGTLSVSASARRPFYLSFDVIYTPKVEGVGEKTSFVCAAIDAGWLTYIKPHVDRKIVALDQPATIQLETNSSGFPELAVSGYDESIISIKLYNDSSIIWQYTITPLALGETTVTVTGYNGVSCTFDVAVLAPPTELNFAQEVYHAYVGEGIDLGMKLGEGEHAPVFEKAGVTKRFAMTDTSGGIYYTSRYFPDGMTGNFVADETGKYFVEAKTYNGFSDSAVVYVYKRADAVSVQMSSDVIRVGETEHAVIATDANGKQFYPRHVRITKGNDIASLEGPILFTTGEGEVEVTVTNEDGTTVSRTFTIEPYPNEIILNATDLTLEIGETFDVEVSFDQGSLPYTISTTEAKGHSYHLLPIRIEENRLIAQNSGTTTISVATDTLVANIHVTVPVGDKTPLIVWPEEDPFPVNGTFQFVVKEMAGNVLPAKFSLWENDQAGTITEDGYFEAVKAGSVSISAMLDDGRKLTKSLKIVQKPLWLRVAAETITMDESIWVTADSDQGKIFPYEIEVTIADESVLKQNGYSLYPQKKGKTYVTYTSVYSGVSTTFLVQVVSEKPEYAATSTMYLPYGVSAYVPKVYNSYGDEVVYRWKISIDNPGEGNPNSTGFTLEEKVITCNWPTAICELIGTKWDGSERVKVVVYGFKLPDEIWIEPESIDLALGTSQSVEVLFDEAGSEIRGVYWAAVNEGIVSFKEYTSGTKNYLNAKAVGLTLIMAILDNETYALCLVNVYDPNARVPGDADDNRTVNIYDALAILKDLSGETVDINLSNADVNGDNQVDIHDAALIMKHGAGWDVTLR